MKIPDELERYLRAVHEANNRIVAQKRRELDPELQDDDVPWLAPESDNLQAQIAGFVVDPTDGKDAPEWALTPAEGKALRDALAVPAGTVWKTWWDVIEWAEKMNAAIDKALGG